MKNPLVLVFVLLNVLVLSCASKGVDDEANNTDVKSESIVSAALSSDFNSILTGPAVSIPEFSDEESKNPKSIVKGAIEGGPVRSVYFHELTRSKLDFIDSVKVDEKGAFVMSTDKFSEPTLCFITFNSGNPPGMPVIISKGSKVALAIKYDGWITYDVKGDKNNELMHELYTTYINHDKNLQDFNREISKIDPTMVTDSLRIAVTTKFQGMEKARSNDITNFIKNRKGSPASYYAVTFLFQEPSMSLMQQAYEKMMETMPTSKYTIDLKKVIDSVAPLEIGGQAPDIVLNNLEGKEVKLSSLRGKVVLIDFWASWCGPCRKENPNVVRVYNQYKDKGFEILGVSLDNNADKWKAAIAMDGLTWKHVSDLKGWQSAAAQLYQVSSIPFTVLLDKNGRIIAKGLRGQQLEQKLSEIL